MVELRARLRDGKEQVQMKCPGCGIWGDVDKDQVEGLVSCKCPECGAHWTVEDNDLHIRIHSE